MSSVDKSPSPDRWKEGKDRATRGERLLEGATDRPYWCRSCGREERGDVIPQGWYSLTRHSGVWDIKAARLGLFCSIRCLGLQLPRIEGIEEDTETRWLPTREKRS